MFDKKCRECGEKIQRKFRYCPWCGASLKKVKNEFGMLGESDFGNIAPDMGLPFGLGKVVDSLVKQLEKEMGSMDLNAQGLPKGFKIQIGKAPVNVNQVVRNEPKKVQNFIVGEEEAERRRKLEKVEASTKVKRLGDLIVYEIDTPGVSEKKDVVITELETGLEIRAYSKDKCYVKTIPLKVEILGWKVGSGKVFVEFRG